MSALYRNPYKRFNFKFGSCLPTDSYLASVNPKIKCYFQNEIIFLRLTSDMCLSYKLDNPARHLSKGQLQVKKTQILQDLSFTVLSF